jgi:hypothetical protein
LDAQFAGGGQLHTEWTRVIANGETIAVTGSITMPPGSARAGMLLNAASGMQKKLANELGFELTELSESVTCVAPPRPPIAVEGSLSGCVHWRRISP